MKIALMGTYGEKCGVAEYTKELINGLLSKGQQVTLIKNQPKDNLYQTDDNFHALFDTPFLTQKNQANVNAMIDVLKTYDILHVQFETNLFHPDWFCPFIKQLKDSNKKIKIVFTMHSGNMWPTMDAALIDCYLSHESMWCTNYIIPMPVKFYDYIIQEPESFKTVTSFGLGRNNDDFIKKSLQNNPDVSYKTTYGHHKWLEREELVKEIKKSWVISLYYPEIGTQVSSSALRLAMGCNRPILISNTNWFKSSLKYDNLYVCDNEQDVTRTIQYLTDPANYAEITNVINSTKQQVIKEKETFDDFITDHVEVYRKVVLNEVDRRQ